MEQKKQTVEDLMQSCVRYFEQHSFTRFTIDRYKSLWRNGIVPFMTERSIEYYDTSVGERYLCAHILGSTFKPLNKDIIRSINVLSDIQRDGTVSKRCCNPCELKLSGQIGLLMEQHLMDLESYRRNKKTIRHHRLHLHRFLSFMESKQISNVNDIKDEHIIIFVSTVTNNNICVASSLRMFFRSLFDKRVLSYDLSAVLQHYRWKRRKKLPSVYTAVEVLQIESSIKREDATGKRNFAMMLLATRLGLRASDIAHLTFDNISWENSRITLSQFKTGKEIELPLLADVGEAIIDYLKHGRKRSESPQVFLYTRAPFAEITSDAVSAAITHQIDLSGIDTTGRKHGSHSMRHSLASRFLEHRVYISVISEALGHQNTDSTMSYLRIDTESLRQCVLDVPVVSELFYEQEGGFYE